jgi:MFS transporter, ACS family, glucarate transporter
VNHRADKPGHFRWIQVFWLAGVGAISYLDRVNISIAGHTIAQPFHLSNPQLGLVFSAFTVGYMLFQIPGGWLADRFGPRKILTLGALWWALFTSLTAWMPEGIGTALFLFWSVRFLLGIGESVMYPSSNRWLANWIPTAERGVANGIIFAGVGAGAALTAGKQCQPG